MCLFKSAQQSFLNSLPIFSYSCVFSLREGLIDERMMFYEFV